MLSNYNLYIFENPALINAAKQAAVWGISSGLASKLTSEKPATKEQKKKNLKNLAISVLTGAGAGAIGSKISE